jgi:hypothetical protein
MMVGIHAGRLELDEVWGYVGKKQKRVERHEISYKGDQNFRALYAHLDWSASLGSPPLPVIQLQPKL